MRYRTNKETLAGLVLLGLGLSFAGYSIMTYRLGTLQQMGPGMFPAILGSLLALLGVANFVQGLGLDDTRPIEVDLRALTTIIGAILVFGLTVNIFGVIPAVALMLVPAVLASDKLGPKEAAIIIAALCLLVYVVFDLLLRLPLRLFRWPF